MRGAPPMRVGRPAAAASPPPRPSRRARPFVPGRPYQWRRRSLASPAGSSRRLTPEVAIRVSRGAGRGLRSFHRGDAEHSMPGSRTRTRSNRVVSDAWSQSVITCVGCWRGQRTLDPCCPPGGSAMVLTLRTLCSLVVLGVFKHSTSPLTHRTGKIDIESRYPPRSLQTMRRRPLHKIR